MSRIDLRETEADHPGFQRFFLSKSSMKDLSTKHLRIELVPVSRVDELAGELFG